VVVALAGWSVLFYFQPPDETRYFGDRNALTATELAYYLRDNAPRAQVYFDGRGRLTYRGFDSIAFIARDAVGIDMYRPWDPADPPHLVGQTVFAVIADHVDELQKVQAWFPGGRAREFRTTDGLHLLTVYEVP